MADNPDTAAPEEWRAIPGFEDRYEVSDRGNVRSLRRQVRGVNRSGRVFTRWRGGRLMKAHSARGGYLRLSLRDEDGCHLVCVHRLVCEAFHGSPPSEFHQAAHNDGSRDNNHAGNLRWATPKENAADRYIHGIDGIGEKNPRALLTERRVREIRRRYIKRYGAVSALAREYGVGAGVISQIVHRRTWKHV